MNITYIDEKLKNNLSKKRYEHSVSTAIEAKKLSSIYQVDQEKAYLAGLVHDCAKELPINQLKQILVGKEYDENFLNNVTLMHAPAGEIVAKNDYNIKDQEILHAIHYHCYGKENMTMLDKVIFIADKIEQKRYYDNIELYREMAYEDINTAMYMFLKFTVTRVTNKNWYLYEKTLEAFDYYRNIIENKAHI